MNHPEPITAHVPLNLIFQDAGEGGKFAGVFQFKFDGPGAEKLKELAGNKTHLMTQGDAVLRITMSHASDSLRGTGISGVYMDGFLTMQEESNE
jgi:hypothetical protein